MNLFLPPTFATSYAARTPFVILDVAVRDKESVSYFLIIIRIDKSILNNFYQDHAWVSDMLGA